MKKNKKSKKLIFRKDLEIVGFDILTLKDLYKANNNAYLASKKALDFFEIVVIEEGSGSHFIGFEHYQLKKQRIVFIGKNQLHAWQQHLNCDGYVILFTEQFLYKNQIQFNDLSYEYPYNSILYGPLIDIPNSQKFNTFLSLVQLIHQEYLLVKYEGRQEILQGLLRTLIIKLQSQLSIKETVKQKKIKDRFIQFQKALDEHNSNVRNANDYLDILGQSYHQLNADVKACSGKSVKAYIDYTIVFKAKCNLANIEINISEIAYSLGFDEPTNFTKFFKKHTQQTPKQFRDWLSKQ